MDELLSILIGPPLVKAIALPSTPSKQQQNPITPICIESEGLLRIQTNTYASLLISPFSNGRTHCDFYLICDKLELFVQTLSGNSH